MLRRRPLLIVLSLSCLALGGSTPPHHSAMTVVPLDGGRAIIQGVRVLAMAIGPDGTVYAGGRDTHDPRTPSQPNPLGVGSVFLVSHDHGAHWSKRVNEEPPPGYVPHYPAWTDYTRWPPNFTVSQLVVDPRHPRTLYAAGGFPYGEGGRGVLHLLLRSTDGGRTWTEPLVYRVNLNAHPPLVTNIVVTPANHQTLIYTPVVNVPAVAINPHDPRRLYLGTDWLGVLRSTDGGASWHYNPNSPSVGTGVAEQIVIDPRQPQTLYVLVQDTTTAGLYRSDNGGSAWQKVWHGGFASTLLLEGQALYLARADGVYASTDHGVHWRTAVNARTLPGFTRKNPAVPDMPAGRVVQALRDQHLGVWDVVAVNSWVDGIQGLYMTANGGNAWHQLTNGRRGPEGTLAVAVGDMEYGYTRLWLDNNVRPRVLFSSNQADGLYRWSMSP